MAGANARQNEVLRDFRRSLPMELLKAREAAMARFRPMLRDHGFTEQQWRVIRALSDYSGIDATELARRSFLLAPSLTRILQFLESENLVKRGSDSKDQRRAVFALTRKGRAVFAKVAPHSESLYATIEAEFGADKLEALYTLLAQFYGTLAAEDDEVESQRASG
jgi:homoprotocatechuate degradation regulator HpaR